MLSLFLAIGAMLLTLASRARLSARAFGDANSSGSGNEATVRAALDRALMALLRGSGTAAGAVLRNGVLTASGTSVQGENLLHDKYGPAKLARGNLGGSLASPVFTFTITPGEANPTDLNGRLLTIVPKPHEGNIATFRILGATPTAGATVCTLETPRTCGSRVLPAGVVEAVINGAEFSAEPYDGFDDENAWLAQPILENGRIARYERLSFTGTSGIATVDNDNDGVLDGVWLPSPGATSSDAKVLEDIPSPLGGTIRFQVSYLVQDLDGRLNINACGVSRPDPAGYPSPENAPLGMGYGPADVDASLLFPNALPPSGTSQFTGSGTTIGSLGGTSTLSANVPPFGVATPLKWPTLSLRSPPLVAPAGSSDASIYNTAPYQKRPAWQTGLIFGRYGVNLVPGNPGDDPVGPSTTSVYPLTVTGPNTVGDLQGRVQLTVDGSNLVFRRPTHTAVIDSTDDPYETRLQWPPIGDDQPYTLQELERVLRSNDADAAELPQRLAAGLEDLVDLARPLITTDSWDTPALTGTSAERVREYRKQLPTHDATVWTSSTNAISPDVACGLRFNLNRPVLTGTSAAAVADQQEYCKGLYTLVVALSADISPPLKKAEIAQWAANMLDFRDADSAMTRFDYDPKPEDGWAPSKTVWGFERPEFLLIDGGTTGPPQNERKVNFYNPWTATLNTNSGTTQIETLDPVFTSPTNPAALHIDKTIAGSRIWKLTVDGTMSSGSATLTGGSAAGFLTRGGTQTLTIKNTLKIERLADPSQPESASNEYRTVNDLNVNDPKTFDRLATSPAARFFHWPNRPFVSQAELFLVPSWDPELANEPRPEMVRSLLDDARKSELLFDKQSPPQLSEVGKRLLDATYVPSRFAGTSITLPASGTNAVSVVGLHKLNSNHLSSWREPGRVNVNTILTGTIASGTSVGAANISDHSVWTTLTGGSFPLQPPADVRKRGATPANPGAPGGGATPATPANPQTWKDKAVARPAQSMADVLAEFLKTTVSGTIETREGHDKNAFLKYSKAIRLANTATIRSHVFAVWITVKIIDDSPNASPPVTRRMFAIIDRSIPVGYSQGWDLNSRDCIRLKRYLE